MPFASTCYLVKNHVLPHMKFSQEALDPDMALCYHLRANNVFMHVHNELDYGHLVNSDSFNTKLTRPDFYQLFTNPLDWEQRYIHPDYHKLFEPNVTFDQPCTDVYRFPIANVKFCEDMVAIMEAFGKWSDGSNSDKRLEGGYEAVPTRDIHMNQVGLEPMWLKFLQIYVRPLQETVYTGYFHNVSDFPVGIGVFLLEFHWVFVLAPALFDELHGALSSGRATVSATPPRLLNVHD